MDNFDSYKLKDKTKHGLIDKIILHDSNVYFVIKNKRNFYRRRQCYR